MLRRLAAILFVFVIAGQVSAGVCGCLGGANKPRHSCCEPKQTGPDAMRPPNCCDEDCMVRQAEKLPQDRTQPAAKIKFQVIAKEAPVLRSTLQRIEARTSLGDSPYSDQRLKYSRPPNLYLRHHAFLI
jgi:hypothetical protein